VSDRPQYSIWLLPRADHEVALTATVSRLSTELGGPLFAPHVTIQGDVALTPDQLRPTLARMAAQTRVLHWPVALVDGTPHFFRCLFLRFDLNPAFKELQAATQLLTGTAHGLSPFPHLSLAYGEAHDAYARQRQLLAGDFAEQAIVFDRLAICRSSSHVPIAEWVVLEQLSLAHD
jgi:hypothetical protein